MNATIQSLKSASEKLDIECVDPRGDGISLRITINGQNYYCIYNKHFFNRSDIQTVCNDKEYTYSILKDKIKYPRYKRYLEPKGAKEYGFEKEILSNEEIVDDILENFKFPIIVKMNRGSKGKNVFKCDSRAEIENAVDTIFNDNILQDNLLLAQEYINIKHEYRVITYKGKIELMYEKDFLDATFNGNLSPLHWDGGKAVLIEDEGLKNSIQEFITPIFPIIPITFAGLDIVEDTNGKYWFIEINNYPMLKILLRD